MGKRDNLVVGLDIGTSKVGVIVAEVNDEGVDIVGIGSAPSYGMRKGVVVNIDSTVESVKKAVEEAEMMAGCDIRSVVVSIGGPHVKGFNSHGIVAVKGREVTQFDIKRVVEQAKAVSIPGDREVIHILPQEFTVDDQEEIRHPLGIHGVRLEAKVHIITGAVANTQNVVRCCHRTGLEVDDIVLGQVAASEAVLMPDEKEVGVAIADIGGGTTDIAVWSQGAIRHSAIIGVGGDHITNDIATGLRTPAAEAEKIKKRHGCAFAKKVDKHEMVTVPGVGGRKESEVPRQTLAEIIEPRMEEILSLVNREIIRAGYEEKCAAGVVLCGGSSLLPGVVDLGEVVFEMPVRPGRPQGVGGLTDVVNSPAYASGVGLVIHGTKNQSRKREKRLDGNFIVRAWERMRDGVEAFF